MKDFVGAYFTIVLIALLLGLAVIVTPIFLIALAAYALFELYRRSPARLERLAREETEVLYRYALGGDVQLSEVEVEDNLRKHWPGELPQALEVQLLEIGKALFHDEGMAPEVPPMPALCNTIEGARYRDQLARIGQARSDRVMQLTALDTISRGLSPIANAVPLLYTDVLVEVSQFLQPLGATIEDIVAPFFAPTDYNHFKRLRDTLDRNLAATHRAHPIMPRDYKHDDAVETYLKGTRLVELFGLLTPFEIPQARRFEHMHVVAGSGHGKTQTLQYLIAKDLDAVGRRDKSVIVIDSQGDLIRNLTEHSGLSADQIVLIDPEDIEWPVSLNLFSVGQERLKSYDALEQERLTNSIIELYDFVLGSLLSAGMTAKQGVVFRYLTRLMFYIPDATIHTFRELLEPDGSKKYQDAISQLEGTARRFFETEFDGKEFSSTKTQVLRRLYGVLKNQTFERMFSRPQSKFDMFSEMNAGKLILVNTAKSLLKEQGTEIFGRFFIALITQAAQERATLPDQDRLPVMVYVDEAQDYFDQNLGIILSQARKYQVGMTMAHQYLGQLGNGLQEAFEANTAIKLAGGVSARDARALASQMGADAELIQRQKKGSFATFIRGLTDRAVPLSFPFFVLEGRRRSTSEELAAIRQHSRNAYAERWTPTISNEDQSQMEPTSQEEQKRTDDPANPSQEL